MVRSALADENLLVYLKNLSKPDCFTVGLILGQSIPGKDFVIHFAKTPPEQPSDKSKSVAPIQKIDDVSEFWVADHAKHATRMLPGGMYVLGIFIVSGDDLLAPFHNKLRTILTQIHKQLSMNQYLYGNPESTEKLVLNYRTTTETVTCKSYNVTTSSVKPAEFKFQPKAMKWNQLECLYDIDQTFPIFKGTFQWTFKKHLQEILETINKSFKSSVILYDNEIKDGDETLESVGKKKKQKSKNTMKDKDSKSIQMSIFMPCDDKNEKAELEITNCRGYIRIMGQVNSKLWVYPKMTINAASGALVQDIVRSLASRFEMHWDSLIDEESVSEDTNSLHEPPRRVLIAIPTHKVMLSDYLFPGEGAQDALVSLQELLDINIQDSKNILDIEGQPDLMEIYPPQESAAVESEENLPIKQLTESSRFMYIMGFVVALIVLIISLIVHFFKG